jgi:ATP-dependent RNA helicase SUPV3L1/SUV3
MLSTEEIYEVAVVDEVQMMADPVRGFAWTRALLGLRADEIHLCGDPGDWVVVFSRKKIFELKWKIEMSTNHKCCVIYGALPPEA